MNRQYLFRGKSTGDLAPWIYGYYHYDNATEVHYICDKDTLYRYEVDPETVSQCISIEDQKDMMIYGGDIVSFIYNGETRIEPVIHYPHITYIGRSQNFTASYLYGQSIPLEIIGTIFDNPELLQPNKDTINP